MLVSFILFHLNMYIYNFILIILISADLYWKKYVKHFTPSSKWMKERIKEAINDISLFHGPILRMFLTLILMFFDIPSLINSCWNWENERH